MESAKIENVTFPYQTALSEANVKKIKCGVEKGPITKNAANNYFNYLESFGSVQELLMKSWFDVQGSKCP